MSTDTKKDLVLKFRIDNLTQNLLDRASAYVNTNRSKFIRQCIREKSQAVIDAHEKTQFTEDDWLMFFEMLDVPYQPTERMKKAKQKYKDITRLE